MTRPSWYGQPWVNQPRKMESSFPVLAHQNLAGPQYASRGRGNRAWVRIIVEEGHNFPILGPQGLTDPEEAIHVGGDTNSPAWNLKAWPFLWRTAREEGTLIPQHGTSGLAGLGGSVVMEGVQLPKFGTPGPVEDGVEIPKPGILAFSCPWGDHLWKNGHSFLRPGTPGTDQPSG